MLPVSQELNAFVVLRFDAPVRFVWWTAGGVRSVVVSCSLVDLVCWRVVACRACVR